MAEYRCPRPGDTPQVGDLVPWDVAYTGRGGRGFVRREYAVITKITHGYAHLARYGERVAVMPIGPYTQLAYVREHPATSPAPEGL